MMKRSGSFAVAALAGVLVMSGCSQKVLVIAHRGASADYPENTIPAFQAAVDAGADMVELDSHVCAEGAIYCLHDHTLDRTTDAKVVLGGEKIHLANVSQADVDRLDAGTWFDARFAGTRVPTLAQALDVIQNGSVTLLERKDGDAQVYAESLENKGLVGELVVQAFDWDFLRDLHAILPQQPLGVLGSKELTAERMEELKTTGAEYVGWSRKDLTPENIESLHAAGYKVLVWTVDNEEDWRHFVDAGVDGIITNRPAELRAWLDHHQN